MAATDPRAERTERLISSRRAAANEKRTRTIRSVEQMLSAKMPVSFVEVARNAGVSTWFVYNNVAVRQTIESAISEQRDLKCTPKQPSDDRTISGLRAEIADARAEIRDLRDERTRLRRRLQRDLGNQIETLGNSELLERVRVLEQENSSLQSALRETTDELAATRAQRDEARADLEGTQLALRQTMRGITAS